MESGSKIYNFDYTFEINKAISNDRTYIYGVASTEDKDRDGDTVSMKSLEKAFHKYMQRNPVLMYDHDGQSDAVGKVIPEFTGEDGTVYKSGVINNELHVVGVISQADSIADIRTQIEEGILKALSIGARARRIVEGVKRKLLVADLLEISVVKVPVNDRAMFSVIKSVCIGDNCPAHDNVIEETTMEKEEIVMLIKGIMDEKATADGMVELQKKYDTLMETHTKSGGEFVDLQKKYDALKASKEGEDGGEDPGMDVIKSMTEKLDALRTEIEGMKITPIKKGVQDGEEVPIVKGMDITSAILSRHYGA